MGKTKQSNGMLSRLTKEVRTLSRLDKKTNAAYKKAQRTFKSVGVRFNHKAVDKEEEADTSGGAYF